MVCPKRYLRGADPRAWRPLHRSPSTRQRACNGRIGNAHCPFSVPFTHAKLLAVAAPDRGGRCRVVGVAQLVERRSVAPNVAGSIPVSHPNFSQCLCGDLAFLRISVYEQYSKRTQNRRWRKLTNLAGRTGDSNGFVALGRRTNSSLKSLASVRLTHC